MPKVVRLSFVYVYVMCVYYSSPLFHSCSTHIYVFVQLCAGGRGGGADGVGTSLAAGVAKRLCYYTGSSSCVLLCALCAGMMDTTAPAAGWL